MFLQEFDRRKILEPSRRPKFPLQAVAKDGTAREHRRNSGPCYQQERTFLVTVDYAGYMQCIEAYRFITFIGCFGTCSAWC